MIVIPFKNKTIILLYCKYFTVTGEEQSWRGSIYYINPTVLTLLAVILCIAAHLSLEVFLSDSLTENKRKNFKNQVKKFIN